MIKDELVALAFADVDETSLANLMDAYAAAKEEFEKSLAVSEERLADVERGIQELEHNRDSRDEFATKVDKVEAKLRCFEEYVRFLKDKLSEQNSWLLDKDVYWSVYRDRIGVLE